MSTILTELRDNVLWLTLNRSEQRNALDVPTLKALHSAVQNAKEDERIRCLVLAAEGRSFCAGADVAEWAEAEANGTLETYGWTEAAHELMVTLSELPVPTIAAIQGAAVGAGMDLSLCCDFRYASTTAKFKAGYTSMAYSPDGGGSWWLPRLIGETAAKQLLFFDELWMADKALAQGLVQEVLEPEQLNNRVAEVAARLALGPTFAYGKTKQLLRASASNDFVTHLDAEKQAALACGRTSDASEAVAASVEKRQPQFQGR